MAIMEQPLTIAFVGLLITAALFGGLIQTGKKFLLYAAIGSVVITALMLVIERTTLTPREAVRATLHVIADDLERNDVEAVVAHVSSGRAELQEEARRRLDEIEVVDVDIKRNLKIDVLSAKGMDVAEATFNCVIRLKPKATRYQDFLNDKRPIPRFLKVRFKLEDGDWRVRDYEMSDPRDGIGT